jgi:hypothetical protein
VLEISGEFVVRLLEGFVVFYYGLEVFQGPGIYFPVLFVLFGEGIQRLVRSSGDFDQVS